MWCKKSEKQRNEVVLDAAALLNSNFFSYDNAITTPQVLDEIKSRSAIAEALVTAGEIQVVEPSSSSIDRVKEIAKDIGELGKLSETDVSVLALALDRRAILITDDFHVQNVAEEMGIEYAPVTEKIRKKIVWVRRCARCGRRPPKNYKGNRCPYCGGKLIYSSN